MYQKKSVEIEKNETQKPEAEAVENQGPAERTPMDVVAMVEEAEKPETRTAKRIRMEGKLIRNLSLCKTLKEAALRAGYSASFADTAVYRKAKSLKFQQKVREFYLASDYLLLPKLARIDNQVMDHLDGKPDQVPKFTGFLRQKKETTKVLTPEQEDVAPTINIASVQNLMLQLHQAPKK